MPTIKNRINLTVPKSTNSLLTALAKRDNISVASKTLDLLQIALEIEEDAYLFGVAEEREKSSVKLVAHEAAWV